MECAYSSNAFSPLLIFENLKGKIIDYKLSSYLVNIKLIETYYYRPEIEVHCNKVYGELGNETYVHIHTVPEPGIYHSKFILITTDKMLRLIIMTTNITEQLVQNCWNDYYKIDIPRSTKMYNTQNVQLLNQYLDAFNIKMKMPIIMYDWTGVQGHLLISIPNKTSHGICFQNIKQFQNKKFGNVRMKGKAIIQTSSGMLGYDIRTVLGTQDITYQYVSNINGMNWILYDLNNNNDTKGKPKYKIQEIESEPFHFKRYTIEYTAHKKQSKWLIITSANLTRQAWGTERYVSMNAEFGITWNTKQEFPEAKSNQKEQIKMISNVN